MIITVVTLAHNRKQNAPPNNEMKEKFLIKGPETIYGPQTVYTNKKNERLKYKCLYNKRVDCY